MDKYCLVNGQDWKTGFLNGLRNSKFFVPVISEAALSRVRDATEDHTYDNVLIEYQAALQVMVCMAMSLLSAVILLYVLLT